jgi:ubiquinone/menaquinone biosynthesis C-methylase UbiE
VDTAQTPNDRTARRTQQAHAFDVIGSRYDEAFPHKDGQVEATSRLAAQLAPGSRVLDVGCGTGLPTARMLCDAGLSVTGVDISTGMLELARQNVPEADVRHLDVVDLKPSLGSFDAAVAFFTLLMLPRVEIPLALRRVASLLRPGAPLLLAMVEADLDDVPIPFLGITIRVTGYPRQDLPPVLADNGFDVEDIRDLAYTPTDPGAPPEVQLFVTARRRSGPLS